MCQCQTTSRRRTGRRRPRTRVHWAQQTRRERIRDWLASNGITVLVQEETGNSGEREQPILDLPPPSATSKQVYLYNTILLHISRYPLLSMVVIEFYCCNRIIFSRRRTPAIYRPWRRIPCPPPPSPPSTSTSTLSSSRINTKWQMRRFRCVQFADVSVSMKKFCPMFKKQFRYFKSNQLFFCYY